MLIVNSLSFGNIIGGGLGLMMGLLLGALDTPIMQDEMTGKQQFIYQAKSMGRRSWSSAKAFAVMGFVFSAAECVVEKVFWDMSKFIILIFMRPLRFNFFDVGTNSGLLFSGTG